MRPTSKHWDQQMTYKFIEHLSDIIVEAEGKTFEKAFESLGSGLFTQMGKAKAAEEIRIAIEAKTLEELVVNSFSEIVAEVEIRGFTPAKIKVEKFDKENKKIEFILLGETKLPKNIIKAVTFHELFVAEEKGKWTLRVLFDI